MSEGKQQEPYLYAIEGVDGEWMDGESCVFSDRASAQDEVDSLNDSGRRTDYRLVPLYRAAAQPAHLVSEAKQQEAFKRICETWQGAAGNAIREDGFQPDVDYLKLAAHQPAAASAQCDECKHLQKYHRLERGGHCIIGGCYCKKFITSTPLESILRLLDVTNGSNLGLAKAAIRYQVNRALTVAQQCEDCIWHKCAGKQGGCGCKCHSLAPVATEETQRLRAALEWALKHTMFGQTDEWKHDYAKAKAVLAQPPAGTPKQQRVLKAAIAWQRGRNGLRHHMEPDEVELNDAVYGLGQLPEGQK